MRKTLPSTIPMQFNNYHRTISSSSSLHDTSNLDDNQCISLFGEPIPPVTGEFLDNLDNYLYGTVHQNSKDNYNLMNEFPRYNSFASQRGNPPSSPSQLTQPPHTIQNTLTRIYSDTHQNSGMVNLTPQIKILPNSSSSSGNITPIMNRNRKNFPQEPVDVDSDTIFETHSTEYEWRNKEIRHSQNSDEFPNFTRLGGNQDDKESKISIVPSKRISNESYSNTDWFKPPHDYQEWSRIPKLRPSSKNVMSINQQNVQRQSPVAVLLHDSNDSSSSGEKEPPPLITNLRQSQPLIRPKTALYKTNSESMIQIPSEEYPVNLPPSGAAAKREVSPVIVTNAIATGSDYRISTPRSHKKSSFTILSDKSPQNSRSSSPLQSATGRISPFLGHGFKEISNLNIKSRLSSSASSLKDLQPKTSATHFKLPLIGSGNNDMSRLENSRRPSVQFDMSSSSKSQLPITTSSRPTVKGSVPNKREKSLPLLRRNSVSLDKVAGSLEKIPKTFDSSGSLLRSSQKQLNKSSVDIYTDNNKALEQKQPYINPNPTSRQRGLLRVISNADGTSKIPVRENSTTSLDDLQTKQSSVSSVKAERRTSSISPERRSSSQTERRSSTATDRRNSNISSVTASDFSFKKNLESGSMTATDVSKQGAQISINKLPQHMKKKGIKLSRKVAKPTTLSPIIGTPNKEVESNSVKMNGLNEDDATASLALTSKIPVRGISRQNSKINFKSNSRAPSTVNSRSNSPSKEYLITSRSNSRPTSRASLRSDSRAQSRSNSRLNIHQEPEPLKDQNTSKKQKKDITRSISPNTKVSVRKSLSPTHSKSRSKENIISDMKESKSKLVSNLRTSSSSISLKGNSIKSVNNSKESTSAKKQTKTVPKPDVNLRRIPSVSKKIATPKDSNSMKSSFTSRRDSKKSSSNLKKEQVNNTDDSIMPLKRESSVVKSIPPPLKKESSVKKIDVSTTRISSTKKRTDSNLAKKLENKSNYKEKIISTDAAANTESEVKEMTEDEVQTDGKAETDSSGKLIPLTKANVVSMTTAAITAQPVQITTAVTNQIPLTKTNSSNQLTITEDDEANKDILPVAILEKSQKTLETIQKTVAVAADEIHKTINENLTDLKTLENEVGKFVENTSPIPSDVKTIPFEKSESLKTILEKPQTNSKQVTTAEMKNSMGENEIMASSGNDVQKTSAPSTQQPVEAEVSVIDQKTSSNKQSDEKNDGHGENGMNNHNMLSTLDTKLHSSLGKDQAEDMSERVSERAISVLPEVECESANLQNYEDESGKDDIGKNGSSSNNRTTENSKKTEENMENISQKESKMIGNPNNPDEMKSSGSQEEIINDDQSTNCCGRRSKCCRCFSRICIPCRRSQISKCCRKKSNPDMMVLNQNEREKQNFWKRFSCCKRKKENTMEPTIPQKRIETISEEPEVGSSSSTTQIGDGETSSVKQNKCYLCLNKFFCCRSTNKVNAITGETKEIKKCCFCIPCRSKKKEQSRAWQQERRESIISEPIPQRARGTQMLEKLMCWKKRPKPTESRRTSMNSKKQSIAPTLPPEDTRPKLHVDLVEFNSKMKGAIPVMPLWLAWFCMVCNCLCPGLGTVFSGFFCLCVGIPRFSQYDSMKARIGSFIINCIVGVAQLFCVLFCFVGWGWSIWWGTIMLKTARKLRKIKRVEQLEMEEEQRQAAAVAGQRDRDVEAGKT